MGKAVEMALLNSKDWKASWGRIRWVLFILAALLLYNLIFTEGFFRIEFKQGHFYGSVVDIIDRAAPVMLLSLGMSLVIATGGVDLSVGAIMAIIGSLAAKFVTELHWPFASVFLLALSAGLGLGLWNGTLVSFIGVQPIVATLILMVAGRGIAQLLTGGQIITFENKGFAFLGGGYFLGVPFSYTIVAVAFVLLAILIRKSALGLFIEAVGDNETASRFSGINSSFIKCLAYGASGLFAALAGLIVAADIKAADANNAGLYLELDAILAVVLGGTALTGGRFFLFNSLVGAILIQTLTTTILTRGIAVELTLVVKALIILVVCLVQSEQFRAAIARPFLRRNEASA
jgi:ribose/xylose/arabinose/galactoside ABC-type transport system permease subunit